MSGTPMHGLAVPAKPADVRDLEFTHWRDANVTLGRDGQATLNHALLSQFRIMTSLEFLPAATWAMVISTDF